MLRLRRALGVVAVLALVGLAGCAGLRGGGSSAGPTPTLTPVPVPDASTPSGGQTATPTPTARATTSAPRTSTAASDVGSRYSSLRPTCTRPPGLVIHIQVAALANNDPATNAGIRTTWRFAAPLNKQYTGPYRNFVEIITTSYRPLLKAERITYHPMNRTETTARRRVTVASGNESTTYQWQLQKQTTGDVEGCWMTTAVKTVASGPGT